MKKDLFTDGISHIDVDAVERLLQIERDMTRKNARQKRTRLLIIPAAALIALLGLLVCMSAVIIPFIPKTYDLDYGESALIEEKPFGNNQNVWVYYVNDNGTQKRERVRIPASTDNVFLTWKHLNAVGDEVKMLDYTEKTNEMQATVVPGTLWEFLQQELFPVSKSVIVTLSPQITSYDNYNALVESLTQTLAKYKGVAPEQVILLMGGEQEHPIGPSDSAISGQLQFTYSANARIFMPGQTVEITVSMTNISDTDVVYYGSQMAFYPDVKLMAKRMTVAGTEVYSLKYLDRPMTDEYAKYVLAPGGTRTITYTFPIPGDAYLSSYSLTVFFGESSCTFNQVITLVKDYNLGYIPSPSVYFSHFMSAYGFHSDSFEGAIEKLSYNGVDLFDILNMVPVDWLPGYHGQIYDSELFQYRWSEYAPEGDTLTREYKFTAYALPDGMTLPCSIAPKDTLFVSLLKMGFDAEDAQVIMAQAQALPEDSNSSAGIPLGEKGSSTLCITRTTAGQYAILYSFTSASSSDDFPPEYSFEIIYSEDDMTFLYFRISAEQEAHPTDVLFNGPIEFDYSGNPTGILCRLADEHLDKVLDILNNRNWQNGSLELICEYQISINGQQFGYSASEGVFCNSEIFLCLSEQDRGTVNTILESYEIIVEE